MRKALLPPRSARHDDGDDVNDAGMDHGSNDDDEDYEDEDECGDLDWVDRLWYVAIDRVTFVLHFLLPLLLILLHDAPSACWPVSPPPVSFGPAA